MELFFQFINCILQWLRQPPALHFVPCPPPIGGIIPKINEKLLLEHEY
jgi:hypothetical protein